MGENSLTGNLYMNLILLKVSSIISETSYSQLAWVTRTKGPKVGSLWRGMADRRIIYFVDTYDKKRICSIVFYVFQSSKLVYALIFLQNLLILKIKIDQEIF